jgi:hypothetical protein
MDPETYAAREWFLGVRFVNERAWGRFFTTHPVTGLITWDTFHWQLPDPNLTERGIAGHLWEAATMAMERQAHQL